MALALVCLPLAAALLACLVRSERLRPWLLPAAAAAHLALALAAIGGPAAPDRGWLVLDPPGRLVLLVASTLFFFCSIYSVHYLRHHQERPNAVFCACMLAFLGLMSLVACAQHLGLLWVAIEATTLATAPLIYFNHTPRSIEATWKYLLVCSVGIAVALLGSFFLGYAMLHGGIEPSLAYGDLLDEAPRLSRPWLRAAFVLLLVGYGTKVGLAPMHTWLPDAHSEAPSPVSALLSGALLNCAFLGVLRAQHLCAAAGEGAFASSVLIAVGLLSMAAAAAFVVGQRDLKRMLAYSSVENMGMLAIGIGVGGLAATGALLHVVMNGLTKGMLFLSAGNIHEAYGSKMAGPVRGAMRRLPLSGAAFLLGFLAITGSPPFGPFLSQLAILNGTLEQGRYVVGGLYLALLLVVFLGMAGTVLPIVQGRPPSRPGAPARGRESLLAAIPVVALLALVVMLGVYLPPPLGALVQNAAAYMDVPESQPWPGWPWHPQRGLRPSEDSLARQEAEQVTQPIEAWP
jgi:hydrogenase-4 component F